MLHPLEILVVKVLIPNVARFNIDMLTLGYIGDHLSHILDFQEKSIISKDPFTVGFLERIIDF